MDYLTIAYTNKHSNLYTAFFDGKGWHGDERISEQPGNISPQSNYNPGAAVYNNWLYLIYKGAHSNHLYTCWNDGRRWYGNVKIRDQNGTINPESNRSPNLIVYKGLLYTIYKGAHSNNLYYAFSNGTTWFGNHKISDMHGGISPESNHNPGMAVFKGNLYFVYKGAHSDHLYIAWYDGHTWYGNKRISDMHGGISPESSYNPGMAVFNSNLYIVYKASSSRHLYSAWFDGKKWHGNKKISDQSGGISPKTTTHPGMGVTISASPPVSRATWMRDLPDSLSIGEINIPGTHDSAAINTSIHTPYATQNTTITQQLEYGIRLLDVRIQISKKSSSYVFTTAHGDIGSSLGVNTYQSLKSLMRECKRFLSNNPTEVVLMSLKVDDWSNVTGKTERNAALSDLKSFLEQFPVAAQPTLPTLGQVRGRIFLYNRFVVDDFHFGVPIEWTFNTSGSYARDYVNRKYKVYVEDQHKDLSITPTAKKLQLVVNAYKQKASSPVVWAFASGTSLGIFGIYIQSSLLDYFGQNAASGRLQTFGWTLFDYPFNFYPTTPYGAMNVVSLIISSNFGYAGYEEPFKVDGFDDRM